MHHDLNVLIRRLRMYFHVGLFKSSLAAWYFSVRPCDAISESHSAAQLEKRINQSYAAQDTFHACRSGFQLPRHNADASFIAATGIKVICGVIPVSYG